MIMYFNSKVTELVNEGSGSTDDDTTLVYDLAVGNSSSLMSNRSSLALSWSTKKSLMLRNVADHVTMLTEGPAERCRSMMSSMLRNVADDDTTLTEDPAERC